MSDNNNQKELNEDNIGTIDEADNDILTNSDADMKDIEDIDDVDDTDNADDDLIHSIDTVILNDEEGNEYEFELLGYVDRDEKVYAILVPADPDNDDDADAVVVMELEFEGDTPNFIFVEDEELATAILYEYANRYADEVELDEESDGADS